MTAPNVAAQQVLPNIQVLRALAALSVVFYHTEFIIPGMRHIDFQGVVTFFVISGFIMTYISRQGAEHFFRDRLTRIIPLYWLATLINALLPGWNIGVEGLLKDLAFIPRFDADGKMLFPTTAVGWTLNLEMFFYAVFAVALRINRRIAPALVALVLTSGIAACFAFDPGRYAKFYFQPNVLFFILGIGCYYAWQRLPKIAETKLGAMTLAVAGAAVIVLLGSVLGPMLPRWFWLVGPPVVVLGALAMHNAGLRITYGPLLLLGNASYTLFLIHLLPLRASHYFGASTTSVAIGALASIPLAIAIYRYVELPMVSYVRSKFDREYMRSDLARSS